MQDYKASEGVVAASWSGGAIWEHEDTMCTNYPFLFQDEGMLFSHLIIK